MDTPVNPSFTIEKWGLKGSKLYRHVFVMNHDGQSSRHTKGRKKKKKKKKKKEMTRHNATFAITQSAFYVNLYRAVIGPSATLTGR